MVRRGKLSSNEHQKLLWKLMGLSLCLRAIYSRSLGHHHPSEKGCQTSAEMQVLECCCDTLGFKANWM